VVALPAAGSDQGQWHAVVLPGDDGVVFTRRSAIDQPIWWATAAGELRNMLDEVVHPRKIITATDLAGVVSAAAGSARQIEMEGF
jgi:hypothetical protein